MLAGQDRQLFLSYLSCCWFEGYFQTFFLLNVLEIYLSTKSALSQKFIYFYFVNIKLILIWKSSFIRVKRKNISFGFLTIFNVTISNNFIKYNN